VTGLQAISGALRAMYHVMSALATGVPSGNPVENTRISEQLSG